MGLRLFQKFSMVWEQFEQQIKTEFLKRFQADEIYQPETHPRALSALCDTVGWRYWKYSAAGAPWFQQFEELFFDSQYYKFRENFIGIVDLMQWQRSGFLSCRIRQRHRYIHRF